MLHPQRFITLAIILLATLVSVGFVQGIWTERWVVRDDSKEIIELEKVPLTVGSWDGKTIEDAPSHPLLPDASNCIQRRYVNRLDGTVATMMITRGLPGPMVIKHLPTECYVSNGYELVDGPNKFFSDRTDSKVPDEFWVSTFKKTKDLVPVTVRVYWSWSGDGQWQAPDRPRFTFARFPMLYKLYVIKALNDEKESFDNAPVHDLIQNLTQEMRRSFFTPKTQ